MFASFSFKSKDNLFFRHIESIYKSLDPGGLGYISLNQYAVGMKTLGIDCFNPNPMACQCDPDSVDKETFEQEA